MTRAWMLSTYVFCNVYIKKDSLRSVEHITSYLFRSFKNNVLNLRKKYARISDSEVETLPFLTEVTIVDNLISEEERSLLQQTVKDLLDKLTDRQREAVYLRYMQNLDYEEIALLMDMNAGSVRKLVCRAIMRMRESNTGNFALSLLIAALFMEESLTYL
jgi:RNA polymerase sigma factor, sigma-70 family